MSKKWRKQTEKYEIVQSSGVRITSTPVCGSLPAVPGSLSPATPTKHETAPGGLKPSEDLNVSTTTDDDLRIPIPSSSSLKRIPPSPAPQPLPDLQKLHRELSHAFARADKPIPTLRQSQAVLDALSDEWPLFLEWLPESRQFEKTQSPGGLPSLIEFFRSVRESIREAAAVPELPPPCPKCRDFAGRILTRITGKGVFAGESYTVLVECDCKLGELLKAGFSRHKAEQPKRSIEFQGFEEPGDNAE